MTKPYIIGITGPTGSGKTYIVDTLHRKFDKEILFLPQDNYFIGIKRADQKWEEMNFDTPEAFENNLLISHLKMAISGQTINIPQYDFKTHTRKKETLTLEPKPIIIVEGVLIFNLEELRNLMHFKVFLDADADVRLTRRLLRDLKERGRVIGDLQETLEGYLEVVKPMQEKYISPMKKYADLALNTNKGSSKAVKILEEHVEGILKTKK